MNAIAKTKEAQSVEYGAGLVEVIARAARDPSVDIDKMERLIAMQERVEERAAQVAFASAFAAMQPELPTITHNGQIIHKGQVISAFSDWPNINKVVTPILARHGFSLSFKPMKPERGGTAIKAVLRHSLGHCDEADLELPSDTSGAKNAVQAIGSSLTYAKRYAGVLILNLTIEGEDDDGAQAAPMIQHEAPRDMPFPQGPAKNKSDLKEKGREAWRQIEAVSSRAQLDAKLEEHSALIEQIKQALPSWWTGGERDGNSFEGLGAIIARIECDFDACDQFNGG
jgi:hypothetical protein